MKKIIFLAVLTLVSSFYALAGNKYQLKLKKGDSFVMTTKIEQKITQNVMGMEITIDLNVNAEMDLVVSELSKGEVLFSQVYKSLMVTMKAPMQGVDISMDSNGESNEYNNAIKSVLGKEVRVKVDVEGNVLSLEGLDQFLSDLRIVEDSGADLLQFFDEEGLQKNFKALFPITYGKNYEQGDTWSLENVKEGEMRVESNTDYLASTVSKNKFEYTSQSSRYVSGDQQQQGMEMSINMNGKFSGKAEMNTKTGLLKSYSQTGMMTGNTVIEANEQMPMDMDIPMTIEMTTVTSLK